jgi:hypothetical protein
MNTKATRRWMIAVGAASFALLGGAALAQGDDTLEIQKHTTIKRDSHVPAAEQRKVNIQVQEVDPANHTATLRVSISPEASITSDGARIRLDELQPGDSIRASFDPKTNELIKLDVLKRSEVP